MRLGFIREQVAAQSSIRIGDLIAQFVTRSAERFHFHLLVTEFAVSASVLFFEIALGFSQIAICVKIALLMLLVLIIGTKLYIALRDVDRGANFPRLSSGEALDLPTLLGSGTRVRIIVNSVGALTDLAAFCELESELFQSEKFRYASAKYLSRFEKSINFAHYHTRVDGCLFIIGLGDQNGNDAKSGAGVIWMLPLNELGVESYKSGGCKAYQLKDEFLCNWSDNVMILLGGIGFRQAAFIQPSDVLIAIAKILRAKGMQDKDVTLLTAAADERRKALLRLLGASVIGSTAAGRPVFSFCFRREWQELLNVA